MSDKKDLREEILEETPEETAEPSEETGEDTSQEEPKDEKDEALETRYLRLMADFQNYKRRSEKEKADVYAYANEKIVVQLLDVIDNFERALDCADTAEKAFAEGMEMIFRQLRDVLKNSNVEEIEALGLDFDPNFHNAVMMEDTEEYESGKVSAVLQKGYTLNGRVIRATMVKVAN
jgi:molecular chaperone GrpE